jgi:putative ABC transport system permease protein
VALCIFGGIAGLLLVGLIALVVNAVQDSFTIGLYFSNLVWGMVISVIIGVISGIVPASVASRLNPVDAIRSK